METIKEVLMRRDNMTSDDADDLIAEAKEALQICIETGGILDAEAVISDYFGLEPDYLMELL